MNLPKERAQRYEDKIKELHTDLEHAAKELDTVNGRLDVARREEKMVIEDIAKKKRELETVSVEITRVNGLIERENKEYTRIVSEQNKYPSDLKKEIAVLEKSKLALEKDVKRLSNLHNECEALAKEATMYELRVQGFKDMIADLEVELSSLRGDKDSILAEISTKRGEVEDLIKKNGKILSDTESNLHRIRIYAKRLQRHYDKLGIKFDALKSFNVNEDEKPS